MKRTEVPFAKMFKNDYQGGPYFEIFTPQGKDVTANWKISGGIKRMYDKEVKSYVYSLEGTPATTRMQLPKDSSRHSLTLVQRFLIFQISVAKGQDFSIEIGVTDLGNNKRRLLFSSSQKETQVTPLHAKIPLAVLRRSTWVNFCVDLVSMVGETWRSQTFKCIESICVSANCKLRKIFTMKIQPPDTAGDEELYGCPSGNAAELDQIPKQCQFASDVHHITQFASDVHHITQLLTLTKIKNVERLKGGSDSHRPGSTLEIDLNSSGRSESGSYRIAFGTKGSISNRSVRSTQSRTDDSLNSSGYHDFSASINTKDGFSTGRSDHKRVLHQHNSRLDHQMVQPHPPREPSSDRLRRRIRVKNDETVGPGNQSYNSNNSLENVKETSTPRNRLHSEGEILRLKAPVSNTDSRRNKSAELPRNSNETAYTNDHSASKVGPEWHVHRGDYNHRHYQEGDGAEIDDSIMNVIDTLNHADMLGLDNKEWEGDEEDTSSEEGENSSPFKIKAYEESDEEEGNEDSMYYFTSPPKSAPRRHLSPSQFDSAIESDMSQSKTVSSKMSSKLSIKGIPSARGPRPEDDFFNDDGSSSEGEDVQKRKKLPGSRPTSGTTSRPHSGTSSRPHSGTSSRPTSNTSSVGTSPKPINHKNRRKDKTQSIDVTVDHVPKTANISPELRTGASHSTLNVEPGNTSFSKMSRKSVREIPKNDARLSQKNYDSAKYAIADVTESFEARMLLSMKRHHEEELEDVTESPRKADNKTQNLTPHNTQQQQPPTKSPRQTNHVDANTRNMYDFSPTLYTSDDDTSYSTWKAPVSCYILALRVIVTVWQIEDWSGVFSPPIVFPNEMKTSTEDLSISSGASPRKEFTDTSPKEISSDEMKEQLDDEEVLDLLYDPCLNCYYDPGTCKYYELV
ncbi:hypothetical protein KUTeg_020128 [Tegillarca granosa]|uniref:CFA20 domain-containing protein n=1 Tax=Tegillarca granosa TaxID=220873 RepID=A0ABQ9E9Q6_TEGGR|nr:hypothetical protein KUTeg_020128 [Tegillarca granosa]